MPPDLTAAGRADYRPWLKASLGLLLVLALLNSLAGTVADPDLWGYLAFGRLFWENGQFPYHDIFSYAPTLDPWVYHEWLTGVLFYPIYQTLGGAALQSLKLALGLGTAGLIYLTARLRGADPLSAALYLWLIHLFLAIGYSPVRAQVFTYAFFALYLYLLEQSRQTGRGQALWWLPLIMVAWCNLHGGFVAGLGLMGFYVVGEALSRRPWRTYAAVLAVAGLATLINPYGLKYWTYIFQAVTMPRPEITEWASIFRAYQQGSITEHEIIYLAVVLIFSGLLAWWARWRELTPALALAVTLYLGLKHVRHEVFFLLLLGAYMPVLLSGFLKALQSRPWWQGLGPRLGRRIPAVLLAGLIGIYAYQFLAKSPLSLKIPAHPGKENQGISYPLGAIDYIRANRWSGKLLVYFNWGEYVIWTLYPQCRVAIDGRYETVYPEAVGLAYFDFLYGRGDWRRFLQDYPPDMILIDIQSKAAGLLSNEPGWRQVYADSGSVLFVRKERR